MEGEREGGRKKRAEGGREEERERKELDGGRKGMVEAQHRREY